MILECEDVVNNILCFCNSDTLKSFSCVCGNSNKFVKEYIIRKYHYIVDNIKIKSYNDNEYGFKTYQKCMFIASYIEYAERKKTNGKFLPRLIMNTTDFQRDQ